MEGSMFEKLQSLLEQKNHFLERFLLLCKTYRSKLLAGDSNDIDLFQQSRQQILNIVEYFDNYIERITASLPENPDAIPPRYRKAVRELIQSKDEIVREILNVDVEVLGLLQIMQDNLDNDLADVRKSKRLTNAYIPDGHAGSQIIDKSF
jgi:hypothetical protein